MDDDVGPTGDERPRRGSPIPSHVVGHRDWRSEAVRIHRRHRIELTVGTVTALALTAAFMLVQLA